MDKKPTILDYFSQVFMVFGIIILLLTIFCKIFGTSAQNFSTIFSLGNLGISIKTILQFFFAIAITVLLRFLFMTDLLIKNLSLVIRIILLFLFSFLNIIIFIILCKWFPVNYPFAWLLFLISYFISCMTSTLISIYKEKIENKKLAEALQKCKKGEL